MNPITTVGQVFDAIQQAKMGGADFRTNFFPVQGKLQGWIDHGELEFEVRGSAAFFFRKDRDFWHLYFSAGSMAELHREVADEASLKEERIVVDLVGNETSLNDMLALFESAGFRRYTRLFRMARASQAVAEPTVADDSRADFAGKGDSRAVLDLIEAAFDRYAEQLPMLYEIEAALESRQILAAKQEGAMAGVLFFETQGLTSALRFVGVAEQFRGLRLGSTLIRRYFQTQRDVRRFLLWVAADNEDAIQKYRHYGYAPDGLIDHVLTKEMVNL